MSDDTPTQRFDQQSGPPTAIPDEPREKRGPLIPILIAVGAVLLVGVIVLGSLLLGRNSGTPQAAATDTQTNTPNTPVPTPTVTVTVTATPAPSTGGGGSNSSGSTGSQHPNGNNVLITNYSITPDRVDCSSSASSTAANLTVKWHSVNGNIAYFGVNTIDAKTGGMGWNLPASGSNQDFPPGQTTLQYPCGDAQQEYTISVYGNGSEQSLQITVKRK